MVLANCSFEESKKKIFSKIRPSNYCPPSFDQKKTLSSNNITKRREKIHNFFFSKDLPVEELSWDGKERTLERKRHSSYVAPVAPVYPIYENVLPYSPKISRPLKLRIEQINVVNEIKETEVKSLIFFLKNYTFTLLNTQIK